MGEDGRKMSKRWGNVINPDSIVIEHGADALRIYEMFMGPFDQACNWNTKGLVGARKFLEKIYGLAEINEFQEVKEVKSLLHKTIKKVGSDIENFAFNTAISALMILVNEIIDYKNRLGALPLSSEDFFKFLQLLAPFAPHLSEELAGNLGKTASIFTSTWPSYDAELIKDEEINLVVQINGKLRATIKVPREISSEEAQELAKKEVAVSKWLEGTQIIKVIFVPEKLLNIVIK